jgi:hypothetical protein
LLRGISRRSQPVAARGDSDEMDEDDFDELVDMDEELEGDFTFRAVAVGLLVGYVLSTYRMGLVLTSIIESSCV